MRIGLFFLSIVTLALWLADCAAPKSTSAASDPYVAERTKYLDQVKKDIAGQENAPADSVFLNIKVFKNVPAERFLGIMDRWGQALGVSCDHCHVKNEWASEVKAPKEISRQMVGLTNGVNTNLKGIKAIKSEDPSISCYTCHRGDITPARRAK